MTPRQVHLLVAAVVCVNCSDPKPLPAPRAVVTTIAANATFVGAAIALGTTPVSTDEHGMPRLLIGSPAVVAPAATASESARLHVVHLAPAWGVRSNELPALEPVGEIAVRGGTIVRLRQVIDGLPIEGGELHVFVRTDGSLVAASGVLIGLGRTRTETQFLDDEAGAIGRAMRHAYRTAFEVQRARARRMWIPTGDTLTAAWVVEAYARATTSAHGDAWHTVIAAADGTVLAHRSLAAAATFSYRVFADTTGARYPFDGPLADPTPNPTGIPNTSYPPFALPNLVIVDGLNHPGGSAIPDPWLASGATETNGNNVDAYTDFTAPDGLTFGDFRATTTSTGVFDRTYDTSVPTLTQPQQMAAIASLFYVTNWLHDFWYDAGFTEAAGNAQNGNFGRGGEDRDALLAEAENDAIAGAVNDTNMTTPEDGMPPRLQAYVWNGRVQSTLTVSGTATLHSIAGFGPAGFAATGTVVIANGSSGTTADACQPLTAPATTKIVLVDRGTCTDKTKALNVQNAGGIAMIEVDDHLETTPPQIADDTTITTAITIGTFGVLASTGASIKTAVMSGPISASLQATVGPKLDGGLDATLIAHCAAKHLVHHRLEHVHDTAKILRVYERQRLGRLRRAADGRSIRRQSHRRVSARRLRLGVVRVRPGVLRHPTSAVQHDRDDQLAVISPHDAGWPKPLPTTEPIHDRGQNSEQHNAGEVWASALWEVYVSLQQQPGAVGLTDVLRRDGRLRSRRHVDDAGRCHADRSARFDPRGDLRGEPSRSRCRDRRVRTARTWKLRGLARTGQY